MRFNLGEVWRSVEGGGEPRRAVVVAVEDDGRKGTLFFDNGDEGSLLWAELGYGQRTPYAATKWAIVGLIKSLAVELGPLGIRANAILPGVVHGERMNRVIADRAAAMGVGFDNMRDDYLRKISLRRMVDASDVANLSLFLASNLARNISGQAISVDGNVEYL